MSLRLSSTKRLWIWMAVTLAFLFSALPCVAFDKLEYSIKGHEVSVSNISEIVCHIFELTINTHQYPGISEWTVRARPFLMLKEGVFMIDAKASSELIQSLDELDTLERRRAVRLDITGVVRVLDEMLENMAGVNFDVNTDFAVGCLGLGSSMQDWRNYAIYSNGVIEYQETCGWGVDTVEFFQSDSVSAWWVSDSVIITSIVDPTTVKYRVPGSDIVSTACLLACKPREDSAANAAATRFLARTILGETVTVKCEPHSERPYYRTSPHRFYIYLDGQCINEIMLSKRLAEFSPQYVYKMHKRLGAISAQAE